MKNRALLATFILLAAISIFSNKTNAQVFEKGTKLVDAGIEFTDYDGAEVIPVYANFEAGVTDDIGVGAKVKFWSKNYVNSFIIQATGNYHFGRIMNLSVEKLDIFGGLGLGINRLTVNYKDLGYGKESESAFIFSPQVGARYYFTEKVGANAKLGFDHYSIDGFGSTSFTFAIGVSFKF